MRVLIAEDDRVSLRMLDGLLSGWGYQVVSASSGIQALQILQQDQLNLGHYTEQMWLNYSLFS